MHSTTLNCNAQHYTELQSTTLNCNAQHYTELQCTALHCTIPHLTIELHCTAHFCTAQFYAPNSAALFITRLHWNAKDVSDDLLADDGLPPLAPVLVDEDIEETPATEVRHPIITNLLLSPSVFSSSQGLLLSCSSYRLCSLRMFLPMRARQSPRLLRARKGRRRRKPRRSPQRGRRSRT